MSYFKLKIQFYKEKNINFAKLTKFNNFSA